MPGVDLEAKAKASSASRMGSSSSILDSATDSGACGCKFLYCRESRQKWNSKLLFTSEAGPFTFIIFPSEARENLRDDSLTAVIKAHGGEVVSVPTEHCVALIDLVFVEQNNFFGSLRPEECNDYDVYSSRFIHFSLQKNRVLDLNARTFRLLEDSLYEKYDANDILYKRVKWSELALVPPPAVQYRKPRKCDKISGAKADVKGSNTPKNRAIHNRSSGPPGNATSTQSKRQVKETVQTQSRTAPPDIPENLQAHVHTRSRSASRAESQSPLKTRPPSRNPAKTKTKSTPVKKSKPSIDESEYVDPFESMYSVSNSGSSSSSSTEPKGNNHRTTGNGTPRRSLSRIMATPMPRSAKERLVKQNQYSLRSATASQNAPNSAIEELQSPRGRPRTPSPVASTSSAISANSASRVAAAVIRGKTVAKPTTVSDRIKTLVREPSPRRVSVVPPIIDDDISVVGFAPAQTQGGRGQAPNYGGRLKSLKRGPTGFSTIEAAVKARERRSKRASASGKSWTQYTRDEDERILAHIVKKNAYRYTTGYNFFKKIEHHFPRHTYQSLYEHFRKKILLNLRGFKNITEEQKELIIEGRKEPGRTGRKETYGVSRA